MQIDLNEAQLKRIIEALRKSFKQKSDQYLINYLETAKNKAQNTVNLDEIPF